MITKELIYEVIDFCNTFINIKNIGYKFTYIGSEDIIILDFKIWSFDEYGFISKTIVNLQKRIHNEDDFIEIKKDIIKNYEEQLPKLLEQLK